MWEQLWGRDPPGGVNKLYSALTAEAAESCWEGWRTVICLAQVPSAGSEPVREVVAAQRPEAPEVD